MSSSRPLPEHAPAAKPTSGIHGDVVALIGRRGALRARAVIAALPQAADRAGCRIGEDARPVHDARPCSGIGQRHLDDVDAEERGVRVLARRRTQPSSSSPERTPPVPEP